MGNILSFFAMACPCMEGIWPVLLQIAPLDLQQVEVIKGANSTLYGGGAIAGLVNLVTKKPGIEPETSMLLNATSAWMQVVSIHPRNFLGNFCLL